MGRSERWRYRSLYLTRSALERLAVELGIEEVPYFTRNDFSDPALVEGFLAMHRALEEGSDAFHEREILVGTFGVLFLRHGSRPLRIQPSLRDQFILAQVRDRIQAEYAADLRLEFLARDVGLTTFQLIRLFKRVSGLTPHAYLTQIRLGMACRRLRRSQAIAEIASDVGFYDQSALTKHFKRCYGITPLQFVHAAGSPGRNFRQ